MSTNVEKLVAALRSGEYKQAQSGLRDETGYCCLGVACDLYAKETGSGRWVERKHQEGFYDFEAQDPNYGEDSAPWVDAYYLPLPVQRWLGWGSRQGAWHPFNSDSNLAALNDQGQTFAQIADVIEAHADDLSKPRYD